MNGSSDQRLERFYFLAGLTADLLAIVSFAAIPINTYAVRFGLTATFGAVAIVLSSVSIYSCVTRWLSPMGSIYGLEGFRLLGAIGVFAIGIGMIAALKWIPHELPDSNQSPASQTVVTSTPA